MDELDKMIVNIVNDPNILETHISFIRSFITNCSLSQFEKLKEMDWD